MLKNKIMVPALIDALNQAANRGDSLGVELIYTQLKQILGPDDILIKEYERHSQSSEDKPTDRSE